MRVSICGDDSRREGGGRRRRRGEGWLALCDVSRICLLNQEE